MEIRWEISKDDIGRVQAFIASQQERSFVRHRIAKNVQRRGIEVTRDVVWLRLVGSLLTTQQRSGPGTPVYRVLQSQPFLLGYEVCCAHDDVESFAATTLQGFGGLRRWKRVAHEVAENFSRLEHHLWSETLERASNLLDTDDAQMERECARFVAAHFQGFGPKQARNLLQSLGLTRYEIPVDSRITKWLRKFGFPVELSAPSLADRGYYEFVLDGFQELCRHSGVYPCVLDAAIFASFDAQDWPEDTRVY